MNTQLTHNQVLELLPAYVLGALEPDEMLAVDAYIRSHPELMPGIDEAERALTQLAYTAPDAPLPASAKMRLLERVAQEQAAARSHVTVPLAPPSGVSLQVRLTRLFRPVRWALVAAVIAGLLLWNIQLQRASNPSAAEIARLAGQAGTRVSLMIDTAAAPGSTGRLFLVPDGGGAALAVSGLPPLPAGKSYQFWFARPDKSRDSAAVFQVGSSGEALINVAIPGPLAQYDQIWITQEPEGGSPKPTPPHYLEGPLVQ